MGWRTVIVNSQSKLDYKLGFLVIRGVETRRIHIDEIQILLIENLAVSLTGCLLEVRVEKKIKVIFCDSKENDKPIDISKNAELLIQFIPFEINKRGLLCKTAARVEKIANEPDYYEETVTEMAGLEKYLWSLTENL